MSDISDNLVGVDELLRTLGQACFGAARQIDSLNDSAALGSKMRYVVPSFKVSVKLVHQHRRHGQGVLFWKKSEGFSSESLSQIDMEIVAVPREASG